MNIEKARWNSGQVSPKGDQLVLGDKEQPKEEHRESPSGFHFYNLYLDCPRKWYLKYVNGLQPESKSSALSFGSAFHEGKEAYWRAIRAVQQGTAEETETTPVVDPADAFLSGFDKGMHAVQRAYEDPEVYTSDLKKGFTMIDDWLSKYDEENRERYIPLEIEVEHKVPIGPNEEFIFTVRPDVVLKDNLKNNIIVEDTKTTGWSLDMTFRVQELGDQLTSYLWAMSKVHPEWRVDFARIDGSYMKGRQVRSEKGTPVYRSQRELLYFEMGLYGIILEVSQKYASLQKYPWQLLFPRNGGQCYKYNRACEYADICRMNIPIGEVPPGFTLDPWAELDSKMKQVQRAFDLDDFSPKAVDKGGEV